MSSRLFNGLTLFLQVLGSDFFLCPDTLFVNFQVHEDFLKKRLSKIVCDNDLKIKKLVCAHYLQIEPFFLVSCLYVLIKQP